MSQTSSRVTIVDNGVQLSKPNVIVGFPEVGLVGTIACSFLVEQLKPAERGFIDSDAMPPVMLVHKSTVTNPVHIFGKDNLVIVLSEIPLPPRLSVEVAREVASWAKSHDANLVVGLTGTPSRRREESQAEERPVVLGVANDKNGTDYLRTSGAQPFEEGILSGFYASLVKYCSAVNQSNVTLLGESLVQFPDPASSAAILEVLGRMLSIGIDTKSLMDESEEIRLRTRQLMQQTQQQQQAQRGSGASAAYR
jgi:uncharacterized protein